MLRGAKLSQILLGWLVLVALSLALPMAATAQDKKKAAEEKPKVPPPEDIVIETDDVELTCTYYPSALGKDAALIILIHGWESRRTELDPLAKFLQEKGEHAVLVPDLRGHGDSNVRKVAPGAPSKTITPADLTPADLLKMASTDFVYIKNKMIERHNAGEFNIDLLTLVGLELGSNLALHWAAVDWMQPEVTIRLGRDVKALVLVSPVAVFKTLRIAAPKGPLGVPAVRASLSIMTIGGTNDPKMDTELSRIHNAVIKYHPEPKIMKNEQPEDFQKRQLRQKDFYERKKETTLQGMELVKAQNLQVPTDIFKFIKVRIVDRAVDKDLPAWEGERRKDPIPGR
jgi:pimeloyl-ACP methyl ester carboxylesterase